MKNTQLSIRRSTSGQFVYDPATIVTPNAAQADALSLVVGHHPIMGANVDSNLQTAPAIAAWPNPVKYTFANTNLLTPGIRLARLLDGDWDDVPFSVGSVAVMSGNCVRRYPDWGSASADDFVDVTSFFQPYPSGQRWVQGLDLLDTNNDHLVVPASSLGQINGSGRKSALTAEEPMISTPYRYGQRAVFDATIPALQNIKAIDSVLDVIVKPRNGVTAITDIWNDWGGINAALGYYGQSIIDLAISIPSDYVDNVKNAASDLYIIIPYAVGQAFINSDGGQLPMPSFMQATIGDYVNYGGAIAYLVVPLTYLKTYNSYSLTASQNTDDTFASTLITAADITPSSARTIVPWTSVAQLSLSPLAPPAFNNSLTPYFTGLSPLQNP